MGIIRAIASAVGGGFADQYLEVFEADQMTDGVLMVPGVAVRKNDKRNQNKKGTLDVITDGSTVMVGQNQFMLLTDGGKVIDYSAEPGYYQVKNGSAPSLFNGQLSESIKETFDRVRFGGATPQAQRVRFINTQEIKNIPFGTSNPINYFDNFYNAELYLRCHGYFSIRITDPLKFFTDAAPQGTERIDSTDLQKLYLAEFLTALQTSIGQMSVDGVRISYITAKSAELAKYLSTALDADWTQRRGMVIESVGIISISYDENSRKLIDMRNQGAMLSDAPIREGYVQGAAARGIEAAGSNAAGAGAAFMGVGMGMQNAGAFMSAASASNQAQMQRQDSAAQVQQAQQTAPAGTWVCSCGQQNTGTFCQGCGKKHEAPAALFCTECGAKAAPGAKFCQSCGNKLNG